MSDPDTVYRGRFAPSPTGRLHFGSLVAAVGSYLQARAHGGTWLVRMEDLDPPREVAGAARAILDTLGAFGMASDEPVLFQSRRADYYAAALECLRRVRAAFDCGCTRRELPPSGIYPGTCRQGIPPRRRPQSVRVRVHDAVVAFDDARQGRFEQNLAREVGDFVVRRADGLTAYQLAVVVDDAAQDVTEVVRGADLLDSTPRQLHLQGLLSLPTPRYAHLPVVVDRRGTKLSKQTRARPVDDDRPGPALAAALAFLGHAPPERYRNGPLRELWAFALDNWRLDQVPARRAIPLETIPLRA